MARNDKIRSITKFIRRKKEHERNKKEKSLKRIGLKESLSFKILIV